MYTIVVPVCLFVIISRKSYWTDFNENLQKKAFKPGSA